MEGRKLLEITVMDLNVNQKLLFDLMYELRKQDVKELYSKDLLNG